MIELYRLTGCPYCARVEEKLDELGELHEPHDVNPFRFLRSEVKEVSGQSGVPVLVDTEHGITGMAESEDIIDYLEETYG
jgi:glutathione S-transferase